MISVVRLRPAGSDRVKVNRSAEGRGRRLPAERRPSQGNADRAGSKPITVDHSARAGRRDDGSRELMRVNPSCCDQFDGRI